MTGLEPGLYVGTLKSVQIKLRTLNIPHQSTSSTSFAAWKWNLCVDKKTIFILNLYE